jgi:hypothetical protein
MKWAIVITLILCQLANGIYQHHKAKNILEPKEHEAEIVIKESDGVRK